MILTWFRNNEKTIIEKAEEANSVLNALGVESHTESGKQIRSALALELLGTRYDLIDKHSKASFIKQNKDVLIDVRQMLIDEGVLSNQGVKRIEDKK